MKRWSAFLVLSIVFRPFVLGLFTPPEGATPASLTALASSLLSQGKSFDALEVYSYLVDHVGRDSIESSVLYKKATVESALGQLSRAKETLADVLTRGEHAPSRLQLAQIDLKLGHFDQALSEIDAYIQPADTVSSRATDVKKDILVAQRNARSAESDSAAGRWENCVVHAGNALDLAAQSGVLRRLRAECAVQTGDFATAFSDYVQTPGAETALLLRASLLGAFFMESGLTVSEQAIVPVKKCLNSDPDNTQCQKLFKALKRLGRELDKLSNWVDSQKWKQVIVSLKGSANVVSSIEELLEKYSSLSVDGTKVLPALGTPSILLHLRETLCEAYVRDGSIKKSAPVCSSVLKENPEHLWALVSLGEEHLLNEEWDKAVDAFRKAFEASGRRSQDIANRLRRAERLLKQSKRKDYYKVLGVARDADERTIKKAYRKATLKAHPDKEGGSEEKMMALNEAYEVLSNPELRARFDNGEDPNDSEQQAQYQNPFGAHSGGQQFFFRSSQGGAFGHPFFQQQGFPF